MTGGNWQPGESVRLFVDDDQTKTWTRNVDVVADDEGRITDSFNLPEWFVATYTVEATGETSGVARTGFTDGNLVFRLATARTTIPTGTFSWTVNWDKWDGAGNAPNTTCSGTRTTSGSSTMSNDSGTGVRINDKSSARPTSVTAPAGYTFDYWSTSVTSTTAASSTCIGGLGGPDVVTLYAHFKLSKSAGSVSINNIPTDAVFGGQFTPTYTKAGDGTADATKTITIAKAVQTITFGSLSNRLFGTAPFTLSASGGASGNPVVFSAKSGSTCSVTGDTVTLTDVGTCTAVAEQAGNANYAAANVERRFGITYGRDGGIRQPINSDNTSLFSRGRSVPVKFGLLHDAPSGFSFSGWSIKRVRVTCPGATTFTAEQEQDALSTSAAGWRYDADSDQYVYNMSFGDVAAGTCWKTRVYLTDGSPYLESPTFKISK